jgi:hypothetical protein
MSNDQREIRVIHRERLGKLHLVPRRIPIGVKGVNIMMKELIVQVDPGQIVLAPFDHSLVNIDSYITARLGILLEQLPREPTAAASEIEHRFTGFERDPEFRIDRGTTWVVEIYCIGRPDPVSQFQGRHGDATC